MSADEFRVDGSLPNTPNKVGGAPSAGLTTSHQHELITGAMINSAAIASHPPSQGQAQTTARTLADYRPQHDEDCEVHHCGHPRCGSGVNTPQWHAQMTGINRHKPFPKPCSCGLDALLRVPSSAQEELERVEQLLLQPDTAFGYNTKNEYILSHVRARLASLQEQTDGK